MEVRRVEEKKKAYHHVKSLGTKNQDGGENSETVYVYCAREGGGEGAFSTRLFAYKGIVIDG